MILHCIRHLSTKWNKLGILQGSRDVEIDNPSKEVLKNIDAQKKHLQTILEESTPILVSPLQRTHQTADLYGYDYAIEPLIAEIDFGTYEGVSKEKMYEKLGENWVDNPYASGLSAQVRDLESRITTFVDQYKTEKQLLIFSHGAFIRGLMSYHTVGDLSKMNTYTVDNNQLVSLEF